MQETDRLRDLFLMLATVPSPSRHEGAVAALVREHAARLGLPCEEDDAAAALGGESGNLLVTVPATGPNAPALLFCSHIDTVETGERPASLTVDGDLIRSDRTTICGADDKTGVAVLLAAMERFAADADAQRGEIRFIFTVAEETELLGAKQLPPAWLDGCAAAFCLDGGDPDKVVLDAPGKNRIDITFCGIGGHATMPEGKVNAAVMAGIAAGHLPSGRLDENSTANVGILSAGTAINVIPDSAHIAYEVRSHDQSLLQLHTGKALAMLDGIVNESAVIHDGELVRGAVETEITPCYESFALAEDALPVALARQAMTDIGLVFQLKQGRGGSDANEFNRRGLPACILGCGMHQVHSTREVASLSEMAACLRVVLGIVSRAADTKGKSSG